MAYSFNDVYRPLRIFMRVDGVIVGLGMGALLLLTAQTRLIAWGLLADGPVWIVRLAGAALVALGIFMLTAAGEELISPGALVTFLTTNSLLAIVILLAYLQREAAALPLLGQIILLALFVLCLVGALLPLRYLRAEYRTP